jgi:hypothetical protein
LAAPQLTYSLLGCQGAAGDILEDLYPSGRRDWHRFSGDRVSQRTNHRFQAGAQRWVRSTQFFFHPVKLPLAANESLHEMKLLSGKLRQAPKAVGTVNGGLAAAAAQTADY